MLSPEGVQIIFQIHFKGVVDYKKKGGGGAGQFSCTAQLSRVFCSTPFLEQCQYFH